MKTIGAIVASTFRDLNAVCPFFIVLKDTHHKEHFLKCEGVYLKTMNVTEFLHKQERDDWFANVCCAHNELCPVYRMLMKEKYADKE